MVACRMAAERRGPRPAGRWVVRTSKEAGSMQRPFKNFIADDSGLESVEYAVVAVVITLAGGFALAAVGFDVGQAYVQLQLIIAFL